MASYRQKQKSPDVAFKPLISNAIVKAITDLAAMQYKLHKVDFTPEELLQLFIPPEQHALLLESYRLAAPRGFVSELYLTLPPKDAALMGVQVASMKFDWDNRRHPDAWLVPNNHGASASMSIRTLQPACPPQLRETFLRMFNDMVAIAYRFGMCRWVYESLNNPKVCSNAAKLRYYWPCILPLLRKAGQPELASELAEPNVRAGEQVILPPDIRPYLKETNTTLARAHFIEADQVPIGNIKMSCQLREVQFFDGKFTGMI